MITSKPLSEYVEADLSPLTDDSQSYPAVYLGGFVHEDGTGLNFRDIIRIANILQDPEQLELVLSDHFVGRKTLEAAVHLGEILKKGVEESGRWTFLEEITTDEIDTFPIPRELNAAQYDELYPYPPCYVGYSIDPHGRYDAYSSCTFFATKLNIAPNTIKSLNHVMNIIADKLDGLDIQWRMKYLWTSWHQYHKLGPVDRHLALLT
jgi:hypothetical protein